MKKISTVTVIGANGTMGSKVAGIFASFGNAHVYMVSRTKEKSIEAIERAVKSVRADSIKDNMEAKDYSELSECVKNSDLVFESVAEKIDIKLEILENIKKYLPKDAWVCSGTSGLSINKMAQNLPGNIRRNYMGMHFFNPPYNMTLCEIIPSEDMTEETKKNVVEYVTDVLLRSAVLVKDAPAFMGNRIGFYLINLAMQYADKYKEKGGIDYIDTIMGGFTGRNMPPIRTADFVGLDIHQAIVDNVYAHTQDSYKEMFALPRYVKELVGWGKLGRKTGEGLYKTVTTDEKKEHYVYDIISKQYRPIKKYQFEFIDKMIINLSEGMYTEAMDVLVKDLSTEARICKELLVKYVLYSLYVNQEVGHSVYDADDAMATGFSWIPPFALIEAFGGKEAFCKVVEQTMQCGQEDGYGTERLLNEEIISKYDYRKFLKAKK